MYFFFLHFILFEAILSDTSLIEMFFIFLFFLITSTNDILCHSLPLFFLNKF